MDVETQLEIKKIKNIIKYRVIVGIWQWNEASRSFNLNFQKVLQVK